MTQSKALSPLPLSDEEVVKRIRACIHVDVGGDAFMAAPLDNLEWELRYGSPEAVRFEAASVVASYRHLIYLSKEKAWHRLQRMRYDLSKPEAAIVPKLPVGTEGEK